MLVTKVVDFLKVNLLICPKWYTNIQDIFGKICKYALVVANHSFSTVCYFHC